MQRNGLTHTAHDPCRNSAPAMDEFMIDIHLHVLPEIDDGADSAETSRSMLSRLAAMGVSRVVATPHLMQPLQAPYRRLVETAHEELEPVAKGLGIDLELGYEHLLDPGLAGRLEAGEPSTLAGSTAVMVELPFIGWPQHVESSLFALQIAGYVPVLAHPERYLEVHRNPELAMAAGERGAVLQLTAGSFVGVYGKTVERSARRLLGLAIERDVRVVLASDAHSDGQRLEKVPSGWAWIAANLDHGQAIVEWSSTAVPAHLLDNTPVEPFNAWVAGRADPLPATGMPSGNARKRWRWLPGSGSRG